MPHITPEEFLEKHGHEYPQASGECVGICQRYYDDVETWSELPPGAARNRLGVVIASLARQIKALGCKCRPLQ